MAEKSKIHIVSRLQSEFNSNFMLDNTTYHVQTEDLGPRSCKIVSRVYLKGEVLYSRQTEYGHLRQLADFREKLGDLMESHHKATISIFSEEHSKKQKTKAEFFEDAKKLLRRGNAKHALAVLVQALEHFPSDPFLLSYYGCLLALVEEKTREGIAICENAIQQLNHSMPFGSEFFYPVFYLNLGRAYLKAGRKREAISAFKKGLRNDPEDLDLLWELKKLGSRKSPPIPFLKRSNPINKYIGMILAKPSRQ